jgi:Fe-S-cluster containining protein
VAELDCKSCGACCCNPDENRREGFVDYVEVSAREPMRDHPDLMRRYVVYNADAAAHLRMDASGKCLALRGPVGRRVSCVIYEHRPVGCRRVQPGTARCLQYRIERGVR